MDDVLDKCVEMGIEFSMGVCGCMVLYGLPEGIFGKVKEDAKDARCRLICATAEDPLLERILFRPGGVWDVLPPNLRESLTICGSPTKEIKKPKVKLVNGDITREGTEVVLSVGSTSTELSLDDDGYTNCNVEDSSDTPLASSPVPSINVRCSNHAHVPIQGAQSAHAEVGD